MDKIGGPLWEAMHYLAFSYPHKPTREQQLWSRQVFEGIGNLLPCPECRHHYAQLFYRDMPFRNESRAALSRWSVNVHNAVNLRLHKPFFSYESALQKYTCAFAPNAPTCPKSFKRSGPTAPQLFLMALLALIAALVLALLAKRWRCKTASQ